MNNKDWDSYLQDLLGDFEPKEDAHWEALDSQLTGSSVESDPMLSDEALKNSLGEYKPTEEVHGWEKLASSLDQADKAFDTEVADKVKHYNAPNDPEAWTLFLKNFSAYKALRLKLMAIKVAEVSAVVLLLFTIFQMNQKGAFPKFDKQKNLKAELYSLDLTANHTTAPYTLPSITKPEGNEGLSELHSGQASTTNPLPVSMITSDLPDLHQKSVKTTSLDLAFLPTLPYLKINHSNTSADNPNFSVSGISKINAFSTNTVASEQNHYITESLDLANIDFEAAWKTKVPYPVFVAPASKGYLVFGMLAQIDFNTLKMPEDILYTNRKQFVFPLQGIQSTGYGAGFTLGVEHERLAFESGIIYNTKTFKPGRSLTLGEGSDQSSVEFDAMQLQLISIPLQLRYKFANASRFNLYAIAGLGMHIIAQSDIDVDVNYNFNSLPAGENPNNHPALSQTIRESQRLSDNFRHKAPFSTQSFVSANIGLGLEYAVTDRKTLFLQTTYQYQIPNLRFSNHNGKHLVSTSIQAGVRTPLGF